MSDLNQMMFLCQTGKGNIEDTLAAIFEQHRLFLVAAAGTTEEQFANKKFAFFVAPNKSLAVFTEEEYAAKKAEAIGATSRSGNPMVVASSKQALAAIVRKYSASGRSNSVCFFGKPPFHLTVPSDTLFPDVSHEEKEQNARISLETPIATKGVDGLKKMLDCNDRSKIANLPTYSFFENFPYLMGKLIQVNNCDPTLMDEALGLQSGLTKKIITEPKADVSVDVLKKYLAYFGLSEYLYRYAGSCSELASQLRQSPHICKYEITTANGSTEEPFELKEIRRQKDKNGAWLYQLVFESEFRVQKCVVTGPLGMIVGKRYCLGGLTPMQKEKDTSAKAVASMPTAEKIDDITEMLKKKSEEEQRSYEQIRRDYVIAFFKRQNEKGRILNLHEAEAYYNRLAKEDDLLDEFFWTHCCPKSVRERLEHEPEYERRKANQPELIKIKNYTAYTLQKAFKIPSYDLYFEMIALRNAPNKTLERLKKDLKKKQEEEAAKDVGEKAAEEA